MIVSNPPYIETKELTKLMPEVRLHEPVLALDGKKDGLYFSFSRINEFEPSSAQAQISRLKILT